jgi:hypothetical protein
MHGSTANEAHYTIAEIAKLWHMSPGKVRPLFEEESGVVRFGRPETRFKRSNLHLRVPHSVMMRVHTRLSIQ